MVIYMQLLNVLHVLAHAGLPQNLLHSTSIIPTDLGNRCELQANCLWQLSEVYSHFTNRYTVLHVVFAVEVYTGAGVL